ncbi:alpha/beta hydrolase [Nocardia vinacea]|uniref:alpha/beta hydrolase family protein n=1 Tax=Nocardia vinacea TaxID=96468 RepID=UPI002E124C19|nr:alpha/beta hydrolase [Nocardia vinacea]
MFTEQLDRCRSFRDERWAGHWQQIAADHANVADAALAQLGGPSVKELLTGGVDIVALGELLAPAVSILSERGAVATPDAVAEFCRTNNGVGEQAAIAVDALIKVITYKFAAAWPGWTPHRLEAHSESRRLCEVLTEALASAMDVRIEHIDIPVPGGDVVHGTAVFPLDAENSPMALLSNGLEGTVAELLLPALSYRPAGMGLFIMEMPGTYTYRQPLAADADQVYLAVVDRLAADRRVDADRIGMLGLSFGAYWSTRMAATDPRLRAVVSNGAPTHRTFQPAGNLGVPEIIIWTLAHATQARNTVDLTRKLNALSLKDRYHTITTPLLVINGETDTLVSTQDSIDIATHAPNALLKLYPGDDHCAMAHAPEWFELSMRFLADHLTHDTTTNS